MKYRSLKECVLDLERHGGLVRVREAVSPHLEIAEIQRRAYAAGAPAMLFENVVGTRFPVLGNLFGTAERCRFLFRDTLRRVERLLQLKARPEDFWRAPLQFASAPWTAWKSLPKRVSRGASLAHRCELPELPQLISWPDDGGPFITLPQVYTESPLAPRVTRSNLGMYRVQLAGNEYAEGRETGLHYQIHRGIGAHHAEALERGEPLKVSVFVGGPPAHTLAAVMPLPPGLSELLFAGMLGGRRFRYLRREGHVLSGDADFCLVGTVDPERTLPEGPFGDHLGYYSLRHDFPVLRVEAVYHREDAIWPFTVVGRPPQEDTQFGKLIHELTRPLVPREIPGVDALHAVDAAGVHPLLLAIARERYVPYGPRVPREILTSANAILGFGQCSLAKYLLVAATEDDPQLDVDDVAAFLKHVLRRVDLSRDLHFQTRTTIDTLDYSGDGLNSGSKLVVAVAGEPRRELRAKWPRGLELPPGLSSPVVVVDGIVVVEAPAFASLSAKDVVARLSEAIAVGAGLDGLPLVVLVDDSEFAGRDLRNFLWVTFTRSNPSHDVHGVGSHFENKHWGCQGPLVIDARLKPHHAPPLLEDPTVSKRVDELCGRGKSLHGVL
jgi:4-hydroxy-3-polyprenylbenzoate decarboxylase